MIFVLDNYDSFTYNLVQYLQMLGAEVVVRRNDEITVEAVLAMKPEAIVLSPGPGRPEQAGIMIDLIRGAGAVPMLGVCLGHQAVGAAFGLATAKLTSQENLADELRAILAEPGPSLTVVKLPEDLGFSPKLSSRKLEDGTLVSATLEDMFPFLDREEFARHMIDPEPRKG